MTQRNHFSKSTLYRAQYVIIIMFAYLSIRVTAATIASIKKPIIRNAYETILLFRVVYNWTVHDGPTVFSSLE